jgi:hypothetical protein
VRAQLVLNLCARFRCLPSQALAEDAEVLRLLEIVRLGAPEPEGGEQGDGW